jgi:hypothetical protein
MRNNRADIHFTIHYSFHYSFHYASRHAHVLQVVTSYEGHRHSFSPGHKIDKDHGGDWGANDWSNDGGLAGPNARMSGVEV